MSKQSTQPDTDRTTQIIAAVVAARSGETSISPSWVATEAMAKLRVKWLLRGNENQQEVYRLAHHHCRDIARRLLRTSFEPDSDSDRDQHELFPNLQSRYPAKPKPDREEPEYIKLEHLQAEDWRFNVDRLRADAQSRLRHADALEDWGSEHFKGRASGQRRAAA